MWLTRSGAGVGGQCRVEAAAGVPDEHVSRRRRPQRGDDRIAAVGQRRLLVDAGAVPGQVDRNPVVPELRQLGDRLIPAPRGVKTAVHEHESH